MKIINCKIHLPRYLAWFLSLALTLWLSNFAGALLSPQPARAQEADIEIQRNTADIGPSGGTQAPGTPFGSLTSAFVLNLNNRFSHGGAIDLNTNLEGDDMSGTIELTGTNTITFTRQSGSLANSMRFSWESWEYQGTAGGANEFIVRSRNTFSFTAPGPPSAQNLDNAPTNIDRCIPFITGVRTSATTDSWTNATPIAWINDSGQLAVDCGGSGDTSTVQVVVVEFTGSNWEVYHGDSGTTSADSGTITLNTDSDGAGGSTGDVTNWSTACIFGQAKGDDDVTDDAIADTNPTFRPAAGTTQVNWAYNAARDGTDNREFVHVLRHPDLVVTRYTSTGNLQGANNVDITSAGLTDLSTSACLISATSSGTGMAYGRGWKNGRLTSLTNFEHWCHRSGNTIDAAIQIIDLSGITSSSSPSVTSPLFFAMSSGNPGTTTQYTFSTSEYVTVTDGGAGWTLSVYSNDWRFSSYWIYSPNVYLKTNGVLATEPTIITGATTNVTETLSGTYSLNTSRNISVRTSGSGGEETYHRPTFSIFLHPTQAAGVYVGTLTFTVV